MIDECDLLWSTVKGFNVPKVLDAMEAGYGGRLPWQYVFAGATMPMIADDTRKNVRAGLKERFPYAKWVKTDNLHEWPDQLVHDFRMVKDKPKSRRWAMLDALDNAIIEVRQRTLVFANSIVSVQQAYEALRSAGPARAPGGRGGGGGGGCRSTGRSGRQNAATRRNMRREERVTVQGPVKEQQPDGMSHGGGGGGPGPIAWTLPQPLCNPMPKAPNRLFLGVPCKRCPPSTHALPSFNKKSLALCHRHHNYWAPRTRNRHRQEHRPQRPTERSDPTQHAKGRTGDCPGPRKGATTRRNVTRGGGGWMPCTGTGRLPAGDPAPSGPPPGPLRRPVERSGGPGEGRNLRQNRGGQDQGQRRGRRAA